MYLIKTDTKFAVIYKENAIKKCENTGNGIVRRPAR